MAEERLRILNMVEDKKITIEEAERLLRALGDEGGARDGASRRAMPPMPAAGDAEGRKPRYLHVQVEKSGDEQVRVRIPLALIRAGVQIGSLIPPHAMEQVDSSLHQKGIPFDLRNLDPKKIDELVDALTELTVDVDNGSETVRVFCA